MKRSAICVVLGIAAGVASGAAQAADVPVRGAKPVPATRSWDWTGTYIGIQAGGGWGDAQQSDALPFLSGRYNVSGGLAGATWGYNWQVGNSVISFESDAAWANIHGTTNGASGLGGPCGGAPSRCEAELQYFGTARLRLGYAVDRWLPYVTGGMATGYIHAAEGTTGSSPTGTGSEFHFGWTAGAGIEAMIDPHWSAKVEYLYTDLRNGHVFTDSFGGGLAFVTESEQMRFHVVRAGLNYRFTPGPSFLPILPSNPGPGGGPWNWSGLYAGINFGAGAGTASQSDIVFDRGSYDVGGSVIGGTVGYNWQGNHWVYGLEGDADFSWIRGGTSGIVDFTTPMCSGGFVVANCDTKLTWLGTARARVGMMWDRLLPYVTGGLAVGSLKSTEGSPAAPAIFGSGTATRAGWTAGAGIEAKIDERWSAKFEYLYVDLGSGKGFTDTYPGGAQVDENVTFHTHMVRGGFNYLFN